MPRNILKLNNYSSLQENPNLILLGSASSILSYERSIALNLNDSLREHVSFAFTRDSELLEAFNTFLLRMKQTGVLQRIQQKWIPNDNQKQEANAAIVLGFENLSFPFLILACGAMAGIALELPNLLICSRRYLTHFVSKP